MELPVKLFKNPGRAYRLLAAEENGDVIWANLVNDEPKEAGNRVPRQEFNNMLQDGWEPDVNTAFTFVNGEFQAVKHRRTL